MAYTVSKREDAAGSCGHRHPGIEETYLVLAGTATFKVGDDVFEAGQ